MAQSAVNSRLHELHGSGYEIVDGQPDVEGWSIRDAEGRRIGEVDDLLFDPELQKVRYVVADLRRNDLDFEKRQVLIPIGIAEIHEKNDELILPGIAAWQIRALPTYHSDAVTDTDEQDIFTVFSSASAGAVTGPAMLQQQSADFYERSQYDHDNLYRQRRTDERPVERSFRRRQVEPERVQTDLRDLPMSTPGNEDRLAERVRQLEAELEELKRERRAE